MFFSVLTEFGQNLCFGVLTKFGQMRLCLGVCKILGCVPYCCVCGRVCVFKIFWECSTLAVCVFQICGRVSRFSWLWCGPSGTQHSLGPLSLGPPHQDPPSPGPRRPLTPILLEADGNRQLLDRNTLLALVQYVSSRVATKTVNRRRRQLMVSDTTRRRADRDIREIHTSFATWSDAVA